jgi:hypothetical protein
MHWLTTKERQAYLRLPHTPKQENNEQNHKLNACMAAAHFQFKK